MANDEQPKDRARRRLMKLAAWVPVGIVSLSAARAHAGRVELSGGTTSATTTSASMMS